MPDDIKRSIEETLRFAHKSGAWILPSIHGAGGVDAEPCGGEVPADLPVLAIPKGGLLSATREELGDCHRCKLSHGRTHIVFGVGNPEADLLFVGEGPGEEEDKRGEPFVGRAGNLLDKMIRAIGLDRCDVYIANVIKCRPPSNRDPARDEIEACIPFLRKQIEAVNPKVICALGRHASVTLTGEELPLGKLRGRLHDFGGIPLIATYHPAYLLRTPSGKRQSWEDLKKVRAILTA